MDQLTDRAPSKQRLNNLKEDKKVRRGGRKFQMRNWVGLALVTSPQRLLLVTCLHKSACGAETEQLFASPPPLVPQRLLWRTAWAPVAHVHWEDPGAMAI